MTETPQLSGKDLARQALAAYKATARTAPANTPVKAKRKRTMRRGDGRDPITLATAITALGADIPLQDGLAGGNLIDQWPTIAPAELATTVQPVAYDPERGILELRPSSPAYATQIRLFQHQLAKHLNTALGRPAVRTIRVLAPGHATACPRPSVLPMSTKITRPYRGPKRRPRIWDTD